MFAIHPSWEKPCISHIKLWGGMANGSFGAVVPIMAFSLEDTPQHAAEYLYVGVHVVRRPHSNDCNFEFFHQGDGKGLPWMM
jgi:hypothetical protein